MPKEDDILNACGHRNSERVKALKELSSAVCPACLLERLDEPKESNLEELAKKAARTGNRKDLQEYLKARRNR